MKRQPKQYGSDGLILQLFGLRRSGNHALISWLVSKIEGRVLHLNEVTCARPYQCFWRARAKGFSRWELHRRSLKLRGKGGVNRHLPAHLLQRLPAGMQSLSIEELDSDVARRPKDALLLSYEDWELDHPKIPRLLRPTERGYERGAETCKVLLLRDPFNLFASLLHSQRMTQANSTFYVRAWKQYAREYLGETDYLGSEILTVNYQEWRDSGEERIRICRRLDIPEDSSAFTDVPATGGGSSFDGVAPDASTLRTGVRWKQYKDDSFYRSLFDEELRLLSFRIYGKAPF